MSRLEQWHNAPHDDFGGDGPGDWCERYVEPEARLLRTLAGGAAT